MTSPNFPDLRKYGPAAWTLAVDPALSTGPVHRRHMFGGAGLALAVAALEELSGRSALWTGAQFLAAVPVGETLSIEARMTGGGRAIGHAALEARAGDSLALTASGSLGPAAESRSDQWPAMPDVPAPEDCDEVIAHKDADSDIHSTLEIRVAHGRFGIFSRAELAPGGRVRVRAWMRHRRRDNDRVALAFMADFVPSTVGNAIGVRAGGNSLDNMIRYCGAEDTEWVLADFAIDAVGGGIGHGQVHLYGQGGALLAIGSQSFKLRAMPRAGEPDGT